MTEKEVEKEVKEPISRQVVLDLNALDILNKVKELMKREGRTGNSYSDAIRWIAQKAKEAYND